MSYQLRVEGFLWRVHAGGEARRGTPGGRCANGVRAHPTAPALRMAQLRDSSAAVCCSPGSPARAATSQGLHLVLSLRSRAESQKKRAHGAVVRGDLITTAPSIIALASRAQFVAALRG